MERNSLSVRKIALFGILTAFVFVATMLHIPTAIGHINLGDAVILLSSYILGPAAFVPAAFGSALGDLIAGYPQYIIPTFIIKGVMGLVGGLLFKKGLPRRIIAGIIVELIMVAGYFAFESLPFMYGPEAALGSVPFNLFQGAVGIIVSIAVSYIPVWQKLIHKEEIML